MNEVWLIVAALGVTTMALKASGPVLLGARSLPAPVMIVIAAMPPALIAALIATQVLGVQGGLAIDERTIGIAVGGALLVRRAPLLVAVIAAATVTALARLL